MNIYWMAMRFFTAPLELSNPLPVEHRFHQLIVVIAQLQQEEGCLPPQQVQEYLIPLPFGETVQEGAVHPLQVPLVALLELSLEAVGCEQVHELPFPGVLGQEGHHAPAVPGGEPQARFLSGTAGAW